MTIEKIKQLILSYKELEPNWDGYGAIQISQENIDSALKLLDIINDTEHLFVCPIPRGGVQFEWSYSNINIEVECLTPNKYTFFKMVDMHSTEMPNINFIKLKELLGREEIVNLKRK